MEPARRGLLLVTLSAVSFGGVAVLSKLALAAGLSVLGLSFWRWGLAFAALAPAVALTRGLALPPRAAAAAFALGFVGQGLTSGLYTASLQYLPAALASFLLYLNPLFVALLAAALLGEALSRRGWLALALALAGLALLSFAPGVAASPLGVALALASAVCYACVITAGRRLTSTEDPLRIAVFLLLGATTAFGLAALLTGAWSVPASPTTWLHVVLLAVVSTALSIGTFYLALPLLGAPRAALVSTLEPVSTFFLGYAVLGEAFLLPQLAGAALVLLAVGALALEPRKAA